MRKLIILILFICTLVIFSIPSFAVSPYGSVTENTSQISILLNHLYNDPEFDIMQDFVALRTAEYEYYLYFNIDENEADYYRYYATTSGYNQVWHFESDSTDSFSLSPNNYTIVGNIAGSLSPSSYRSFLYYTVGKASIVFIAIVLAFFVFRIRKRSGGVSL